MKTNKLVKFLERASKLKRLGALKNHPDYHLVQEATSFLKADASVSQRLWHIKNEIYHIPTCKVCSATVSWDKTDGGKYRLYCSSKCAHNDPEFISVVKQKNLKKFGHEVPMHAPHIREKTIAGWKQKYGVDNPSKHDEIKQKISKSNIKRKNKHLKQTEEVRKLIDEGKTQREIGAVLGITQPRVSVLLGHLELKTTTASFDSSVQREVYEFISNNYNGPIIFNDSSLISPHHLDIVLPEKKLAIEVDGVYWHSELSGKDKKYHLHKTERGLEKGFHIIHIWDSEWEYKNQQTRSRIMSKIGMSERLFARHCTVKRIDSNQYRTFVEENHIQGSRPAAIRLGLFHGNDLVSVMSFTEKSDGEFELLRYCSLGGCNVVGGASKLLSYFKLEYDPSTIYSFADRRWNTGALYPALGFKFQYNTAPNYWYFKRTGDCRKLFSRVNFQKHKLKNKLEFFDSSKTEWENMIDNGYDRIWDCGSSKWIWERD